MAFDVDRVRAAYPALADGYAYLDGAAGTQLPYAVIDAVAGAYRAGLGNSGGAFPASRRSDLITAECRRAVADLTGGRAEGVILGPNMTTLTYRLARTLAAGWGPGDEVVVTRLDHDANVRPWVQAAARAGAAVRFADVQLPEGDLPLATLAELISDRTRLVAVSAASNLIGTRPDVAGITALAHAAGALSYVDGVHATPHGPVDVAGLGADFYATSAYKWSGPHVGAVVADPGLLETLAPDKLAPAPREVPDRFEQGTLPFADLAGVTAAVEHLASLGGPGPGTRRERILGGMAAAEAHEQDLFRVLLGGLEAMDHVTTYGKAARRTATAYFTVSGRTPRQVAEHLATRRVNVWDGDNYAWELAGALGLRDSGGAVRAGLVHYNNRSDVGRLLAAVAELAG
jgi:cysteine desulfurase family protein (TIGR01976 family)